MTPDQYPQAWRERAEELFPPDFSACFKIYGSHDMRSAFLLGMSELQPQVDRLREALKPFAELFGELSETKVRQGGEVFQYNSAKITVQDIYTAFEALSVK